MCKVCKVEIRRVRGDIRFGPVLNDVLMRSSREGNSHSWSNWPIRMSFLFEGLE